MQKQKKLKRRKKMTKKFKKNPLWILVFILISIKFILLGLKIGFCGYFVSVLSIISLIIYVSSGNKK